MKKKDNKSELFQRHQANCERIEEIANLCETENRGRNEAEEAEYRSLVTDNEMISMKLRAMDALGKNAHVDTDELLRENLLNDRKVTVVMKREIQGTEALADTGIIPVAEQEMLKPIREGLIYDKVGITIQHGLVGTLRWPAHTKARASFADEKERLTDSSIDFEALSMKGTRMGIAIPVTREELENSTGVVERVVREEIPAAIIDLVNDALLSPEGTYTYMDGSNTMTANKRVVGPFVEQAKEENLLVFNNAVPTRKNVLEIRTKVVASGIKLKAPCWVMTEAMKATLEDVKVDSGSGRFVCENDTILGYPVFTSSAIGEGYIGFGDWSYQAAGFFGSMNLIADPYTLSRNNAVDFVLNGGFGTTTLRNEAFALAKFGN